MRSVISGPSIVTGNLDSAQSRDPDVGPSLLYQGDGIIDPRFVGSIDAAPSQSKVYGLYTNSYVVSTDALPVALSTTLIAAGQATTAATPMTLASAAAAGLALNIPIIPLGQAYNTGNLVTIPVALDFGFTAVNGAGTTTVTINTQAWRFFSKGMRLCIAQGATATAPLFCTVVTPPVPNGTTMVVDTVVRSASNLPCGTAHPTLNAAWGYVTAGCVALQDPAQGVARAVSITGNAASTAQVFTVRGYDVYGQAMTEAISFAGGAVTTNGKKAWKYISSVTPATTDAGHTLSVGTTDILGINVRADFWEYMDIFVAGAFITASTGWVVADATNATTTTGDVRGTYALQTASNWDGTTANWSSQRRVAIFTSLPMYNAIGASNLNYVTLFGNTNV